ncbi:OmpA family protein [Oligoflexus tunisiensis]|uniref:OmpA family protein n=1 Tax=Oligoflexus tunisiensis TaxID=708132 RepID=UPI000A8D7AA8|nr:OmpA family protein [Oligoflexus tunisiensis]
MNMKLVNSLVLGILTVEGIAYSQDQMRECRVPFQWDSAEVPSQAVEDCVSTLRLQAATQEPLQIVGSATPEGTTEYNQRLSERRAENLKTALLQRVPELQVEARGIGEIPQNGLVARIVVEEPTPESQAVAEETIEREELTAAVGTSDVTATATPAIGGNWRVGPRLGMDHSRVEEKDDYFAPGLDVAYVPQTGIQNLRVEVGAIGNVYLKGDDQEMTSLHFAPMVGYQSAGGLIAGVRGLVGAVQSDISDDTLDDAGAELRLGRETRTWSAFLGAGQTENIDRIGLDIGWRF